MAIPLRPVDDEPEPGTDSWWPTDLSLLGDRPPLEPTLGGLGLVYPGKRHVFSGPQESAKTLAAYAIGISVIRTGCVVCLIDFEMGPWDARNRLRELGATQEEIAAVRYVEPSEPATDARIDALVDLGPELVIVDAAAGAYDIQGLDDNKRADVERWARLYVGRFWRAGIASIVLDHVVKNLETRGKYAIGSERKVGGADVHLGFELVSPIRRGSSGLYKIITHKDRGGYLQRGRLADLHLTSDPESHAISWEFRPYDGPAESGGFRPTHLMQMVSEYVASSEDPPSRNSVERNVKGKRAEYVRAAIDALVGEGYLDLADGPRGARLLTSIRLFNEERDAIERLNRDADSPVTAADDGIPF